MLVIPCYDIAAAEARYRTLIPDRRGAGAAGASQRQEMTSGMYASILPAVWSFQLALRSRGLGSVLTTAHQADQPAMAEILGIPTAWHQTCAHPGRARRRRLQAIAPQAGRRRIVLEPLGPAGVSERPLVIHVGVRPARRRSSMPHGCAEIAGRPRRRAAGRLRPEPRRADPPRPRAARARPRRGRDRARSTTSSPRSPTAEVMLTLNAPLDLPGLAPQLRWIQAIGSGVGQFVASRPARRATSRSPTRPVSAPRRSRSGSLGRMLAGLQAARRARGPAAARTSGREALGALVEGRTARGGRARRDRHPRSRYGCAAFGVHTIGVRRIVHPGADRTRRSTSSSDPTTCHEVLGRAHVVVVGRARNRGEREPVRRRPRSRRCGAGALFVNVARAARSSTRTRSSARSRVRAPPCRGDRRRPRRAAADRQPALGHPEPRDLAAQLRVGRPLPRDASSTSSPTTSAATSRGEELRNVVDLTGGY